MAAPTRRSVLAAASLLPWLGAPASADAATPLTKGSTILVAYFTRSGNTKVIAGTLQRALKADLFEIRPATPYPDDYEATVAQNRREKASGFAPPLAETVPAIARYDSLFLGFPIWDSTAPPVIRSFLKAHDLGGKTIRPFITHGGFGLGDSLEVLRAHAPGAAIQPPFVMEAEAERRTLTEVNDWLGTIRNS